MKNLFIAALFLIGFTTGAIGTTKEEAKYEAEGNVELENFTWNGSGFSNVLIAEFSIDNYSDYNVKDIKIKCTSLAKSGTELGVNQEVLYDIVNANSKKKFKDFNMGFVHSQTYHLHCMFIDFQIK